MITVQIIADQIFKLRHLRSGSAARLAGWEQISTVEEEDDENYDRKGETSVITLPGGPVATGQTRRLHGSTCTNKTNNSTGIIIKSLINQNELLRQDDVNFLNFVNKEDCDRIRPTERKTQRKTVHHVKFTCPRIKHSFSFSSSSSLPPPPAAAAATKTTATSSLLKPNEWIPLKIFQKVATVGTVKRTQSEFDISVISNNKNIVNSASNNIPSNLPSCETGDLSSTEPYSHILRVPILGSRQSGKTTLVKQFINCIDPGNPLPTCNNPDYYDPMISFNDRLYHVRLIDCPPIEKKFPTSSIDEWERYRGWGLRNASAFILVFDVNSELSFQYIRQLRDQIISEFSDIPLLLVANKIDSLQQPTSGSNSANALPSFCSSSSSSAMTLSTPGPLQSTTSNSHNNRYNIRRDVNIIIKKQWKRTVLVECSAKYNWHVMNVFKELMRILESREQAHKATAARAVQNALRNNQCSIM
ncbi:unnamed protein product [Heterobilharzia americana]|nr:unnamed protein product [Heterobilharzia americana]